MTPAPQLAEATRPKPEGKDGPGPAGKASTGGELSERARGQVGELSALLMKSDAAGFAVRLRQTEFGAAPAADCSFFLALFEACRMTPANSPELLGCVFRALGELPRTSAPHAAQVVGHAFGLMRLGLPDQGLALTELTSVVRLLGELLSQANGQLHRHAITGLMDALGPKRRHDDLFVGAIAWFGPQRDTTAMQELLPFLHEACVSTSGREGAAITLVNAMHHLAENVRIEVSAAPDCIRARMTILMDAITNHCASSREPDEPLATRHVLEKAFNFSLAIMSQTRRSFAMLPTLIPILEAEARLPGQRTLTAARVKDAVDHCMPKEAQPTFLAESLELRRRAKALDEDPGALSPPGPGPASAARTDTKARPVKPAMDPIERLRTLHASPSPESAAAFRRHLAAADRGDSLEAQRQFFRRLFQACGLRATDDCPLLRDAVSAISPPAASGPEASHAARAIGWAFGSLLMADPKLREVSADAAYQCAVRLTANMKQAEHAPVYPSLVAGLVESVGAHRTTEKVVEALTAPLWGCALPASTCTEVMRQLIPALYDAWTTPIGLQAAATYLAASNYRAYETGLPVSGEGDSVVARTRILMDAVRSHEPPGPGGARTVAHSMETVLRFAFDHIHQTGKYRLLPSLHPILEAYVRLPPPHLITMSGLNARLAPFEFNIHQHVTTKGWDPAYGEFQQAIEKLRLCGQALTEAPAVRPSDAGPQAGPPVHRRARDAKARGADTEAAAGPKQRKPPVRAQAPALPHAPGGPVAADLPLDALLAAPPRRLDALKAQMLKCLGELAVGESQAPVDELDAPALDLSQLQHILRKLTAAAPGMTPAQLAAFAQTLAEFMGGHRVPLSQRREFTRLLLDELPPDHRKAAQSALDSAYRKT